MRRKVGDPIPRSQLDFTSRFDRPFCTLEYRSSVQASDRSSSIDQVVLLVMKDGRGGLEFQAFPDLLQIVDESDLQYINDVLLDLPKRARRYPKLLFQQLSSLSLGPLITHKVGIAGVDDQYLIGACAHFVDLRNSTSAAGVHRFGEAGLPATQTQRLIDELRQINVLNDALLRAIPFSMDIVDADGNILFMNQQMEEAIGRQPKGCFVANQDDSHQCLNCPLNEPIQAGKTASLQIDCGPAGKTYEICHTGMIYLGRPALLEIFLDITDRKRIEERQKLAEASLWWQANYDSLTGLPNRRLFQDRLEQAIKNLRDDQHSLALLFIDVDDFKVVNDSFSHNIGDQLLVEVARRISGCVRRGDTVARLGGDEFTVIVPAVPHGRRITPIAEKIQSELARPFVLDGLILNVTASIGIALYPADAADSEHLVINADRAMYQAKALGRNQFNYFTAAMQPGVQMPGTGVAAVARCSAHPRVARQTRN